MTGPASAGRVGWLGGSFDPVHEGHLAVARTAAEHLGLDRVLMVPAAQPPHKLDRVLAPSTERLALLELACADDPRLVPCDVELDRPGPSYSFDTAVELQRRLGTEARLFYLIGADTLADLASWSRLPELADRVTFCAVTRPGVDLDPDHLLPLLGAERVRHLREHFVHMEPHPASSTAIREALAQGRRPEHVPAAVLAAIAERGLYGSSGSSSSSSPSSRGT